MADAIAQVDALLARVVDGGHRAPGVPNSVWEQWWRDFGSTLELGEPQPEEERICPKCGGALVKRYSKFGEFFGCSEYPACRYTCNA